MDTISLKPERMAQLEEYTQRHGQDPAAALDDALATYLEWERVETTVEAERDCNGPRYRAPDIQSINVFSKTLLHRG